MVMNVSFTARHTSISEDTKQYTLDKVEHLTRFFDRITDVKAVVSEEKGGYCCEFVISVPNHSKIVVKKSADLLYTAIDNAISTSERQLRQYKDKMRERKGHLHDQPDMI
jgi:ribosomal subunit interface protein